MTHTATILSMIACIALCGCESIKIPDLPQLPLPTTTTTTIPPAQFADEINSADITWLGVDVGRWPVTHSLKVSYTATEIIYDQGATAAWPAKNNISGNVWIIAKINGKWYAATHEFMRPNTRARGKNTLNMDHIERREFEGWSPKQGEQVGHVVTGICRGDLRNVQERTQIVVNTWK